MGEAEHKAVGGVNLTDYIELDRQFRELEENVQPEQIALDSYTTALFGRDSSLSWNDLLKRRLIVLLGEPGSGKTYEFRHKCEQLRHSGEFAFFIPLDSLIGGTLEAVLGHELYCNFNAWKEGDANATFLLDSVDEAKFRKTSDFYRSLDIFRNALGSECLRRSTILLSSRVSEWQPHRDRSEVLSRFPQASLPGDTEGVPNSQKDDPILVVQMIPLDRDRVHCYVSARKISNPEAFIEELDQQYLWEFVRRPVDVVDILNYWQGHDKFGSLTEMIEYSIVSNLRASQRDRNDPLSEQEARDGAEILGAATVLCRRFNFKVPDEIFSCSEVLDTNLCLPETWPLNKQQAMLIRPIFDSSSYGRIRFHTRRVAEYLTAAWFTRRMNEGCPITELEVLLFDCEGEQRIMRLAMKPIIAWLCSGSERWNEDVRNWVLQSNPGVHFQYGDPSSLPLDYKRQIIQALVRMSEGRKWLLLNSSNEALCRLADPGFSDDLCRIISDESVEDLRKEMIQLVRFGRLIGCLQTILDVVESPNEPDRLKQYAVAAIRDMGDEPSRQRLARIINEWDDISHGLCAVVCEALYPRILDGQDLISLLRKARSTMPEDHGLVYSLKSLLGSVMKPEDNTTILDGLLGLVESPGCSWALEVMPTVLLSLTRKSNLIPGEVEIAIKSLQLVAHHNFNGALHDEKLEDLDQATIQQPFIRRRYLWRSVEAHRKQNGNEPTSWMIFPAYFQILHPSEIDLDWLVDDIEYREDPRDRVFALRLAMDIWHQSGGRRRDRLTIRKSLGRDASLLTLYKQLSQGGRLLSFKRLRYKYIDRALGNRSWRKMKLRIVKKRWDWIRSEWILLWNIRSLRSGERSNWLFCLCREIRDTASRNTLGVQSWESLRRNRGQWVSSAAKDGCKQFWRTFVPELPHQKTNPSTTVNELIVGLTGIQAVFDDGNIDLSTIVPEDADLAVRYAVNDLAGFPPWMPDLVKHKPESVRKVLCECIRGEWETSQDSSTDFSVMGKLVWHGDHVIPLIQDKLVELLSANDPENYSILVSTLLVLLRPENPLTDQVADIAQNRISLLPSDAQSFSLWMAVWLQLDAGLAIDRLEQVLSKTETNKQIMVQICAILGTERLRRAPILDNPSYITPRHCQRFIPLVYRNIKPSQDIDHSDKAENRYCAQMFRDALLQRLSQSEDEQAVDVLNELLHVPELTNRHDWILHLLDEQVERQADLSPWTVNDVRIFMRDYEIDPKTDSDLFRIACRRLTDIKHDVEKSDNSLREEMRSDNDEPVLRRWLARQLTDRSRNRYTVPQEEEIDQEKRPDLCIDNPQTATISIELKWAENWTVSELLERLKNQLLGQYLRSENRRFGMYVLAVIGKRPADYWARPQSTERLKFDQVLEIIEERAKKLVAESGHVQAIKVIGIDFRQPLL